MKKIISRNISFILFLFCAVTCYAAFQEFYVIPVSGNNTNGGDNTTLATDVGGKWTNAASSYTASSGTPFSGVAAGQFASVFVAGQSTSSYISRVVSVDAGGAGLLLSALNFAGTNPPTGTYSCRVGGAWAGPSLTTNFPFPFATGALVDVSSDSTRINLINTSSYTIAVGIQFPTNNSSITYQGYTTTPGDQGRAIIGGNNVGFVMLNLNQAQGFNFIDLAFQDTNQVNSAGGTVGSATLFLRCLFKNMVNACASPGSLTNFEQCEFTKCNTANGVNNAAIVTGGTTLRIDRCYIHDNVGSNNDGIKATAGGTAYITNSIFANSGRNGISLAETTAGDPVTIHNCDFYNNASNGISFTATAKTNLYIINSNFINNGAVGVANTSTNTVILNTNGFFGNTSGTVTGIATEMSDFNYSANPYYNATIGDFRIKSRSGIGTGQGNFVTVASSSSITGYPNVGAVESKPSPGGGFVISN